MLNKDLAGFFAFFLGVFGVHRFYLGQSWRGAAQFIGFWGIIAILAENGPEMPLPFILVGMILAPIITAIVFWATPYEKWAAKYDPEALIAQGYSPPLETRSRNWSRSASVAQPKTSLKSLKSEGVKYYRSGDFDLALEAFQEARDSAPTDPAVHFNLACCNALLGHYPEALRELELSVTYRLPKPERIEQHPALEQLRKSPAYSAFRTNNYRQLNLLELTREFSATEEPDDVLEDFAAPPPSAGANDRSTDADLLEQMNRLRELHYAGVLTQQEYRKQREKLLG